MNFTNFCSIHSINQWKDRKDIVSGNIAFFFWLARGIIGNCFLSDQCKLFDAIELIEPISEGNVISSMNRIPTKLIFGENYPIKGFSYWCSSLSWEVPWHHFQRCSGNNGRRFSSAVQNDSGTRKSSASSEYAKLRLKPWLTPSLLRHHLPADSRST